MKLLLDTCTFIWTISNLDKLSTQAIDALQEPKNELFLSSVSLWEIVTKYDKGKIEIETGNKNLDEFLIYQRKQHDITSLAFCENSALYLARLPKIHQDPFDRMLICQALAKNLILVTPDRYIKKYPVKTLW